jgi:hypothetical protein
MELFLHEPKLQYAINVKSVQWNQRYALFVQVIKN